MADDFPVQPALPPSPAPRRRAALPPAARDHGPLGASDVGATDPWRRYLTAVRRYKWFVLTVTLVGTGLGAVSTRLLQPRLHIYAARANIWIDATSDPQSEEHTSELQSHHDLVCRLLLEKKKK